MNESEQKILSLDDFADASGKTILVRIDINAPAKYGAPKDSPRFAECAPTIRELLKKQARVVLLAHQGRPGEKDFFPLMQHAELLSKHLKKKVKYVDDLFGSRAQAEVKKLKEGKAILLENTRFYSEELLEASPEELAQTIFVKTLASLAQAFVNEAFSVSHRAQASLVGFPELLPSYAGRAFVRELEAIACATSRAEHPVVFVLGGGKPDDCVKLLKHGLEAGTADKFLVGGVIGELCLLALGKDLGAKTRWLEEKGFTKLVAEIKRAIDAHGTEKILLPRDFAYADEDGIRVEVPLEKLAGSNFTAFDIGSETAKEFAREISRARTIYFKGPVGAFEQPAFEAGTRLVLKAIEVSHAFSLLGGGHSLAAVEKFGVSKKKISHVSMAGGALLAVLSGERLAGIEALEKSAKKFGMMT